MVAVTVSPASGQLLDDSALIRRIFDHLDNGTTDLAPETWSEPVANYLSPARLAAEVEVLRRQPTPFCPSAALPEAGSYLARSAAGVPIVAVRGRDGRVRAFRNACRHRGTTVASGSGCSKALVCPYHGWVYGLDGSLRQVPDGYGFPGLDKVDRGLVAVRAEERGGLVLVTQDGPDEQADGDSSVGWLPPDLIAGDQQLTGSGDTEIAANWKVFAEGFLEGYHIKATHRETFLPFGYDNVNVVETFGRHSRVTFPFRRVEGLRDRPPASWRIDGMATVVHHVFPNTMVVRFSHHTLVAMLEPIAFDRTRLVTFQLAGRSPAEDRAAGDDARRDADFVALGAVEDLAMAEAVQAGLASGANEVLTFGRFEGALAHFHRHLDELVEAVGA